MKKLRTRILSSFLCLMMVFGSFANVPLTANATETAEITVSENIITADATAQPATKESISANDSGEAEISDEDTMELVPTEDNITAEGATADESTAIPPTDTTGESEAGSGESESEVMPETITVSFYDTKGKTLLMSYEFDCEDISPFESAGIDVEALMPVYKGYSLDYWTDQYNDEFTPYGIYCASFEEDMTFYAHWSDEPYEFEIDYNLNKGKLSDEIEIPMYFNVKTKTFDLPIPTRKNYIFKGWYTDKKFKNKVTQIKKGTYVDSDKNGQVSSYKLYAKWASAKPGKPSKPTAKHSAKGKIAVSFKAVKGAEGYEIIYATNKSFSKNKLQKDLGKKKSMTLSNLVKGTTYYFKVRAYRTDSTGAKVYGKCSAVKSCKVKSGVKEYTATKNSGKLKKVSIKNNTDLYVKATVSKRLKSSDNFYYLVKVDPNNGKVLKAISKTDKTTSVVFQLPVRDDKGNNHIQGKYGVAVKKGKKYMLITSTSFISNPEDAATYTGDFPTPASKKGRQGCYDISLGDKNYFANFNLNTIIGTKSSHDVAYKYNGKTYYFYRPNFYSLSGINADGGTVTVQIMLQYDQNCKDLILKSGRIPGAHYYAFNTEEKAAREKLEAAFNFLAEQGSQQNCHIDNWILGNEVNTYANMNALWYYAGNISREKFIDNYASTFRMLYYAVKSNNKNGRVYICCDHTWINRENDWGTRYFTEAFHKEIKSQNKNIQWNLAYHAYSAVLTNADFWNDGSLAPKNLNADFVSPNNLEIMTDYIKTNFGKDVRIILSEQGFSYSGGVGSPYNVGRQTGESVQAAAMAWLYYKAQFNDMIDAVIFSSGDHGGAGFQFDIIGRKAEKVYKYMDTPKYEKYTKAYLSTIGASSWKSVVKNFSDKKLKKMPTRK